jgi:hypothetical protein
MGKQKIKPNCRRRTLRLPGLEHCKMAVLNSLGSPHRAASTACASNHAVWPQTPSTNSLPLYAASRTRPQTRGC